MNKTKTQTEYLRRVNKAIEFIVTHLDQSISLDDIANASHFSPYHFHRIFQGIVGETVNDYVSRKKMEKAACILIANPEVSITEIAELRGFSSSANFAKAFKLYFGVSPTQLRNPKEKHNSKIGKIYSKYGKAFNVQDLYSQFVTDSVIFEADKLEEMMMDIKVKEMEEKQVAFLTAPKGYELEAIFETWDKISKWAESKGVADYENKRFAVCHDNPMITPEEKCRYDACIEIGNNIDVISPYTKATIPSGKYAVAYFKGDGDKVSNLYMEMYSNWLPNSGFEPDNYPPIAHYLNDSRQYKDGLVEMELHLKVKELVSS